MECFPLTNPCCHLPTAIILKYALCIIPAAMRRIPLVVSTAQPSTTPWTPTTCLHHKRMMVQTNTCTGPLSLGLNKIPSAHAPMIFHAFPSIPDRNRRAPSKPDLYTRWKPSSQRPNQTKKWQTLPYRKKLFSPSEDSSPFLKPKSPPPLTDTSQQSHENMGGNHIQGPTKPIKTHKAKPAAPTLEESESHNDTDVVFH